MQPETNNKLNDYLLQYKNGLLDDTIPFWLPRALDKEHGGYFTSFDRDGTLLHSDKSVWFQGRFSWLLSTLFIEADAKDEYLDAAKLGIDFLEKHCFDNDGRMFFSVTHDGRPLRKRRYLFSETFAIIAFAAYARAAKKPEYAQKALDLFKMVLKYYKTPGLCEPKTDPDVRPLKGLAMPMILTVTAQELRKAVDDKICTEIINESINEIKTDFYKPEFKCLLESVGPNGEFYDNFDGRMINPGHSIEAGWFILAESAIRNNDPELTKLGCQIINWSFQRGWDPEHGGIFYFRDAKNLPATEYWHDMKFWWPHNEAIIASLYAYKLTKEYKYLQWHELINSWTYRHFPDPVYGEWYGYLHRDGSISTPIKGNMWKGPFHIPRMQLTAWKLLEQINLHS